MPGVELPLNIFETCHKDMVKDVVSGNRFVGIVQPWKDADSSKRPALHGVGCAGIITDYSETRDGNLLIVVTGICRFKILNEMPNIGSYRTALVSYSRFRSDFYALDDTDFPRKALEHSLRSYFEVKSIDADWQAIKSTSDCALVSAMIMVAPFSSMEKQALLEAENLVEQGRVLCFLLDTAVMEVQQAGPGGDVTSFRV